MNTPTHLLLNWTVAKWAGGKWVGRDKVPGRAVLLGSIAPDVPLYLLSFGGIAWFRYVEGRESADIARHMYSNLFYNDVAWISLHNALHSPLLLVVVLALLLFRVRGSAIRIWWAWFFASCLMHTLVDIPVHHDDGPLIFWPLNWTYRYSSSISYWDPHHHGPTVMLIEAIVVVALIANLAYQRLRTRAR